MASYFIRAPRQPYCPSSGIDHREVTTSRCSDNNSVIRPSAHDHLFPLTPRLYLLAMIHLIRLPKPLRDLQEAPHTSLRCLGSYLGMLILTGSKLSNAKQTASQNQVFRRPSTSTFVSWPGALEVGRVSGEGSWSTCQNDKEW